MTPETLKWAGTMVRFLVNTEGCGYPPFVNCSLFALKYGNVALKDITKMEIIDQPMTQELYRHGNSTAMRTGPLMLAATPSENDVLVGTLPSSSTPSNQLEETDAAAAAGRAFIVFACYYSRAYPDRVVAEYDWHHTIKTLVAAVVIPWTLFFVSCAVLCYWYCPALKREFMIDKRKTAAMKTENPQLVIRYN